VDLPADPDSQLGVIMATCDSGEVLHASKCFLAIQPHLLRAITVQLLCEILRSNNPMASCDPAELMENAKCFSCLPPNQQLAIQTQLLCEILHGGATAQTCLICVPNPPVDPAPCDCTIGYSSPPNPGVWVWDSALNVWDEVIAPGP